MQQQQRETVLHVNIYIPNVQTLSRAGAEGSSSADCTEGSGSALLMPEFARLTVQSNDYQVIC